MNDEGVRVFASCISPEVEGVLVKTELVQSLGREATIEKAVEAARLCVRNMRDSQHGSEAAEDVPLLGSAKTRK